MADDGVVDKVAARLTLDITPAQKALLQLPADYQQAMQKMVQADASIGNALIESQTQSGERRRALSYKQQETLRQMQQDGDLVRMMTMQSFQNQEVKLQQDFNARMQQIEMANQSTRDALMQASNLQTMAVVNESFMKQETLQKESDARMERENERHVQQMMNSQTMADERLRQLQARGTPSVGTSGSSGFHISALEMGKDMLMWGAFSTIFQNVQEGLVNISKDAAGLQQVFHGNIQTQDQLNQVTNQFIDIAKQYGASVDEVMQAGKLWGRQYSEQVSEVLTGNSTLLSIVDNLSVTDANKAVESSMQALGLQIHNVNDAYTNSMRIIDSWTSVSHSTSVSTKDLADGFERAAASAKQVGINVDQLSALVAAGVRNSGRTGTVVGNMWKSVMDNIATGSTKVQDAFSALGIQMYTTGADGQKTMKPVWDLLMQLSQASQTATVAQTKYFSAIAGGKYQFDTMRASVTDLTTIQNAYNESLKSAGITQEKAQAQMHTLAAELTRLKDTIQQMAKNAESGGFGDVLRGLVIGLTDLIEGFQKLPAGVDYGLLALGGFLIAGKALSGMVSTLSTTFKVLGSSVSFWMNPVKSLSGAMTELSTSLGMKNAMVRASAVADAEQAVGATAAAGAITAEGAAAAAATPEFAMLDAVTGGLALVVGAAITGVTLFTGGLGAMSNASASAAQSAQQLNQQLQQEGEQAQTNADKTVQNINQLQSLKSAYEQATQALATAKKGTDDYKKAEADLLDIKSQMIGIVGQEKTDQILASKDIVKAINDEVQAMLDANVKSLEAVNNRLKNEQLLTDGTVQQSNKRIEAYQNEINAMSQVAQFGGSHAFDTQGAMTSQSSIDAQTNMDALSAQQEGAWRRSSQYQSWLNRSTTGPLGDAVAAAQAQADAHRKNPNIVLNTTAIGGDSGGGSSSSSGGKSASSASAAVTKMATDTLRSYNEQLKLTSDNMSMYDTTLSKTLTDLHSHVTSTQDVTTATKAYDSEVQSIKAHQAALTAENEKIRQLLPTIPQLDSEYQTLTDTLSSNTKALSDDSQKLADITSQVTSEITNMLQTAYQDQQKLQEQALANIYQPEIDALNAKKAAIDANIQALQQEWAAQDNVNKLTDLQNQLSAVMADKRFEVVGLDGKLSYTYDTAKAADLQKQISDEQTKEAHDAQIQRLNDQKAALDTEITNLTNAYNEKKQQLDAYWAWKQSTDQIQTDANNLILKNGLTGALAYVQTYTSQMIDKYNSLQQAAALAGQAIAGGLGGSGIPITGSGGSSTGLNSYWQNVKNQGGAYATPSGNGMTLAQQIQHEASMYGIDPSQVQVTSGGHTFVPWQYVQNYLNKQSAHMRNGGMVPLNMGIQGVDSVPAMLAPGEIVIPSWDHLLSGMKQINNSASTSVHIDRLEFPNVHNAADAQGFMEAFLDSVRTLR
jgi:hypothetical protein